MEPDFAPLWLPTDERTAAQHGAVGPPERVDGWTWPSLLIASVFGSWSKTIARGGVVLCGLAFLAILPTLLVGSYLDLPRILLWQISLIGFLLIATRPVRSVSVANVAAFWLTGMFASALIADSIDRLIVMIPRFGLGAVDWHRPIVAALSMMLPLMLAVMIGRRTWRRLGLSDLVVTGFAIGSGFAFHEDGLWDHAESLGFNPAGHAVWVGLLGFAFGLVTHHRHNLVAVISGSAIAVVVLADQTVLELGRFPALALVAMTAVALFDDRRRLAAVAERDHLFPQPDGAGIDLLVARYRRLRNGVHTSIAAHGESWPPLRGAPVAELARAARAAGVATGAKSSQLGWDRNPDDRAGASMRFFGPQGWTPFVTVDGEAHEVAPLSRPDATTRLADPASDRTSSDWKDDPLMLVVAAAVLMLVGYGAFNATTDALGAPILTSAPTTLPLIRTIIGAVGAAAAVIGSSQPELGDAWELGPPDQEV